MPSPEERDRALLLVRRAEGDEAVLDRLLDDPGVPDEVLGFHAQQTIEKRLKAVLVFNGVGFQRSHLISYLISLIEQNGIEAPARREELEALTPWAVVGRYDEPFEAVLDRAAIQHLVSAVREWSQGLLAPN